jgi:activator of HSP90 ATPase
VRKKVQKRSGQSVGVSTRSIIRDSVILPAPAHILYATYIDPAMHAAMTGAPVTISPEAGSPFSAFDGSLSGATLATIPARLVVQSWRSVSFSRDDPDSTLILTFTPQGPDGRIDLLQFDVPAADYAGVTQGWEKYYWEPWRRYLAASR